MRMSHDAGGSGARPRQEETRSAADVVATEGEDIRMLQSAVTRIVERQLELQSAITRMAQHQAEIQSEVSRMVAAVERLAEREAERKAEHQEQQDRTLSAADAFSLYARALEDCRVRFPGDLNFPLAEFTWRRLREDFPVSDGVARRVLRVAFTWPALNTLESMLVEYPKDSAESIWGRLRPLLFNKSHRQQFQMPHLMTNSWNNGVFEKTPSFYNYQGEASNAWLHITQIISETPASEAPAHQESPGKQP